MLPSCLASFFGTSHCLFGLPNPVSTFPLISKSVHVFTCTSDCSHLGHLNLSTWKTPSSSTQTVATSLKPLPPSLAPFPPSLPSLPLLSPPPLSLDTAFYVAQADPKLTIFLQMELTKSLWLCPGVTYLSNIQGRVYAEGSIHEDVGPQELHPGRKQTADNVIY